MLGSTGWSWPWAVAAVAVTVVMAVCIFCIDLQAKKTHTRKTNMKPEDIPLEKIQNVIYKPGQTFFGLFSIRVLSRHVLVNPIRLSTWSAVLRADLWQKIQNFSVRLRKRKFFDGWWWYSARIMVEKMGVSPIVVFKNRPWWLWEKGYIKLLIFLEALTRCLIKFCLANWLEILSFCQLRSCDTEILPFSFGFDLKEITADHHPTFGCVEFHVVTITQNSEVLRVRAATSWILLPLSLGAALGKIWRGKAWTLVFSGVAWCIILIKVSMQMWPCLTCWNPAVPIWSGRVPSPFI